MASVLDSQVSWGTWLFGKISLVMVVALLSLPGCRRKPATPSAPVTESVAPAPRPSAAKPTDSPTKQPARPVEEAPDQLPTAPNDASLRYPVHKELTSAVHLFRTDYQTLPPDFETLVKLKYLKAMPTPPPGKRYALDRNRLQVVILD